MKFTIATCVLAALVVAIVASVAQALHFTKYKGTGEEFENKNGNGLYKSVKECGEFVPGPGACFNCCRQFGLIPTEGRLLILTPGLRQCKCLTEAEYEKKRANRG